MEDQTEPRATVEEVSIRNIFFYIAYVCFYLYMFVKKGDIVLLLFLLAPAYFIVKSMKERKEFQPSVLEIAFGFAGAFYELDGYFLILLLLAPYSLIFLLRSKDIGKSVVLGYYLWSTCGLVVYSLSLMNIASFDLGMLLIFLMPAAVLFKLRGGLEDALKDLRSEACLQELTRLLVVFLTVTAVFHFVVNDSTIPRTLGNIIYTNSYIVYESLEKYGIEGVWQPQLGGGAPVFTVDSSLLYHDVGFMHAAASRLGFGFKFIETFNLIVFNFVLLIAISLHYLAKTINPRNETLNMMLPAVFLTLYSFISYFSFFGAVKALSVMPPLVILLASLLGRKEINWTEASFLSAMALLHHFVSAIEFLIPCICVWLLRPLLHQTPWKEHLYALTKKPFLTSILLALSLIAVYLFPALYYSQYITPKHEGLTAAEFLEDYSTSIPQSLAQLSLFTNLLQDTLAMKLKESDALGGVLFIASLACITISSLKEKKLISKATIALIALVVFLLAIGVADQLTLGKNMEFGRGSRAVWGLVLVIVVAEAYSMLPQKTKKIALILLGAYLITSSTFAYEGISTWYSERFTTNPSYQHLISMISKVPKDGRWVTFGIWEGVDTLLPVVSNVQTSLEQFYQSQHTRTIIEKVRGELRGDEKIYNAHNADYLINQMINTGTKYLWFDICEKQGLDVYNKLQDKIAIFSKLDNCQWFGAIDNTHLAETVHISSQQYPEEDIYSQPEGYKTIWITDPKTGSLQQPNKPNTGETKTLDLTRQNPWTITITGNLSQGDWTLIKEKYSPLWHATQDNQETQIYKTNTGMMVINSQSQNPIQLQAQPLPLQQICALITLLATIATWHLTTNKTTPFIQKNT